MAAVARNQRGYLVYFISNRGGGEERDGEAETDFREMRKCRRVCVKMVFLSKGDLL